MHAQNSDIQGQTSDLVALMFMVLIQEQIKKEKYFDQLDVPTLL